MFHETLKKKQQKNQTVTGRFSLLFPVNENSCEKSSSMKSSHIAKKKKKKRFFCTRFPSLRRNEWKILKKASVRPRKVNTVHLLRNSSTVSKIHCLPSSDPRSHFNLDLAIVTKLQEAQTCQWRSNGRGVHTRGHRGLPPIRSASVPPSPRAHTSSSTGVSIILHGWFINSLSEKISASSIFVHSSHFLRQIVYRVFSQLLWYLLGNGGGLGILHAGPLTQWANWVDGCWEHALDPSARISEEAESAGGGQSVGRSGLHSLGGCWCAACKELKAGKPHTPASHTLLSDVRFQPTWSRKRRPL